MEGWSFPPKKDMLLGYGVLLFQNLVDFVVMRRCFPVSYILLSIAVTIFLELLFEVANFPLYLVFRQDPSNLLLSLSWILAQYFSTL